MHEWLLGWSPSLGAQGAMALTGLLLGVVATLRFRSRAKRSGGHDGAR